MTDLPDEIVERVARAWCGIAPIPNKEIAMQAARAALQASGWGEMHQAAKEAEYYINNPSAWNCFDQRISNAIEKMTKALQVKP